MCILHMLEGTFHFTLPIWLSAEFAQVMLNISDLIDCCNTVPVTRCYYCRLVKATAGIAKPRKEDLIIDTESEDEFKKYRKPDIDGIKPKPNSKLCSFSSSLLLL